MTNSQSLAMLNVPLVFTYFVYFAYGYRHSTLSCVIKRVQRHLMSNVAETVSTSSTSSLPIWDKEAWKKGYSTCKLETAAVLEGLIPEDLEGTFFWNGLAKFEVGKEQIMHPLDADGMVFGINLKDGKATFRNRFVRTKGYMKDIRSRRITSRGVFGTEKSGGMLSNMFDVKLKNVANTNVLYWGGKLLALWEAGLPHKLEVDSLRTLGEYTFRGLLEKDNAFGAHYRYDLQNNKLVTFTYKTRLNDFDLTFLEFDTKFQVTNKRTLTLPGIPFFHDFMITKNFYIFLKSPLTLDRLPFILGLKSAVECIQKEKDKQPIIYLVPRDNTREIIQIPVNNHFSFHFTNAYEENGNLIFEETSSDKMDIAPYRKKSVPLLQQMDYETDVQYSTLVRYILSPPDKSSSNNQWTVQRKQVCNRYVDFPCINPRVSGVKHSFAYSLVGCKPGVSTPLQGLIKYDLDAGKESIWFGEPYEYLSECVFANKKASHGDGGSDSQGMSDSVGEAEDDGYLLSYLFNGRDMTSEFVVFDAKDVTKGPICRLPTPTLVPFGLHGTFVPNLTFNPEDIIRRFKACLAVESRRWNEVKGGFSGLGISYDLD